MADRLEEAGDDAKVEIVVPEGGGRARLSVDKLGAVGELESLTWLKATTEAMLPRIDLPDLLFEVHSWTGFLDSFGHVSDRRTRMEGLFVSLVALLVSQSCNIGLTPVIDPENKALTRSRLSHVDQNYVRADTLSAANAALIAAQSRIELDQMWGGGLLASVDGLRFVVPVKSINTGPSPKYYGYKRGVTWLNAVNDQVAEIGAMVVRGTPRDSLYTLDTLLNLDGGLKGGSGGPVGQSGPGPQRRGALEHALPGRRRGPAPRGGPRHQGRGCRPPLPAQGPAHQLPGPLPVQHQVQRPRPGPAPLP
jgi:hypothetical protein